MGQKLNEQKGRIIYYTLVQFSVRSSFSLRPNLCPTWLLPNPSSRGSHGAFFGSVRP
jgi:hypothetical protein